MKDAGSLKGELAFVMRPVPSNMARGDQAVLIGGLPRLPREMDWPRQEDGTPIHFFAEIDLSRLPRERDGYRAPDFPKTGTMFVFLHLGEPGFHYHCKAQVLYTEVSVTGLPERDPPDGLENVLESDLSYMHPSGMTHGGTVVLRRPVEVLSVEDDWEPYSEFKDKKITKALNAAERLASPLATYIAERERAAALPYRYYRHGKDLNLTCLDWKFVFDWSIFFYRRCVRRSIKELRKAETTWWTKRLKERRLKRLEHLRDSFDSKYDQSDAQKQDVSPDRLHPPKASSGFDKQAAQWAALAADFEGRLPGVMQEAFVRMLVDIDRRADERTADGERLNSGVNLLERTVRGSSFNAGTTVTYASDAFAHALKADPNRFGRYDDGLTPQQRWDITVMNIDAHGMIAADRTREVLGATPLQMFGSADPIQNAIDEHVGDVLLMQVGQAHGLPFDIPPDMVLHLWISPEDLADGNFDNVETTIEMS